MNLDQKISTLPEAALQTKLCDLPFPRISNALVHAAYYGDKKFGGITRQSKIGDLAQATMADILSLKGIGRYSLSKFLSWAESLRMVGETSQPKKINKKHADRWFAIFVANSASGTANAARIADAGIEEFAIRFDGEGTTP